LQKAGVWSVQPGIESLIDDVLDRMDKGISAVHNIRMLRDGETVGLTVSWNWLYGFPGEQAADYNTVHKQISALVHLQPPAGVSRIDVHRFAPYYENPELGFRERWAAEVFQYVYDVPEQELEDLVYVFDAPPQGLSEQEVRPVRDAVDTWIENYRHSSLTWRDASDGLIVRDRRVGWPAQDYLFGEGRDRSTWLELYQGHNEKALVRKLSSRGILWDENELHEWLTNLLSLGLVFTEGGKWIALATPASRVLSPSRPEKPSTISLDITAATV
jgi:hypothetical protein